MRIVALEVEDFGVFSGSHRCELVGSKTRTGVPARALVVGHNGSGKSTLFRAISLALYGPGSQGSRVSRQAYQEHLRSLIHRGASAASDSNRMAARVAVDLEHVRLGQTETMRLERAWRCRGDSVEETATASRIAEDGRVLGPVEEHVVAELLPPDLRRIMLVDVALVDELTQALQSPGALERIMRELSGLKLVERLRADLLTVHAQAQPDTPRAQDAERLQAWSDRVREIDDVLEEKRGIVEQAQTDVADIERAIAEKERELLSVGGGLAANRPALRERLVVVETELEQAVSELRDLCTGALPFALCPGMCLDLDTRLGHEALRSGAESLSAFADEWLDEVCGELVADKGFRELVPQPERRVAISEHLRESARRSLEARVRPSKQAPVHDLSEKDRLALRSWIAEAVGVIPSRVSALSMAFDRLESTRDSTLEELDRVADENGLEEVQTGLRGLRERLVETNANSLRAQDALDALETERLNLMSQARELEEGLAKTAAGDKVAELIHRTRLTLVDFEQEQLQRRAAEFAEALVGIFNGLSRKQTLLATAEFDPVTGAFSLADREGRPLDVAKLSTGELQLYSMAVLESLRVTSGKDYPLLVDTPLAYLDEQHRESLLSGVLFGSQSQVVLFVTDQEMDATALERWRPSADRAYRLRFDTARRSTLIAALDDVEAPLSRPAEGQVA